MSEEVITVFPAGTWEIIYPVWPNRVGEIRRIDAATAPDKESAVIASDTAPARLPEA